MLLRFAVMRQMSVPATLLGILTETSLSCLLPQRIQKKDALHECLKLQGNLSQNAHKALWKVLTPSDSAFDD